MEIALSKYIVNSDAAQAPLSNWLVVFSTRSQKSFVLSRQTWDCLRKGQFSMIPISIVDDLLEACVLVPAGEDELRSVIQASESAMENEQTLVECVLPTASCNFGCNYCGQSHTQQRLSEASQLRIVNRVSSLLSNPHYRKLHIKWFGGEPLSAMPVLRSLTPQFQRITELNEQHFTAAVTTNGYALTQEIAEELTSRMSVKHIEVTIDGLRDTHDSRRPLKSGRGTFDRVISNLASASRIVDSDVRCVLRCNVDRGNAGEIPELIQYLADLEFQRYVDLYFAPVHDWGNEASSNSLVPEDYARREIGWFALMKSLGFSVPLVPEAKPIVCMAVNQHARLTDPYGNEHNCTELPLVPVSKLNVDSIKQSSTESKSEDGSPSNEYSRFVKDVASGNFDCSTCEMLPVCGGGCPKSWYEGKPPCPSAKRNLPDRLLMAFAEHGSDQLGLHEAEYAS